MKQEETYNLIVKVTVTPMVYIASGDRFAQAVAQSLREGTEALRGVASKVGFQILDSNHHYETREGT